MPPYIGPTLHCPTPYLPHTADLPYATLHGWPTLHWWHPYADDLAHTNNLPNSKDLLNSEFLQVISGCDPLCTFPEPSGEITNPAGFKEVRDFLKKVQVICDTANAQKQGAADVAAALADVKPRVHVFVSSPDLILIFCYAHMHLAPARLQDH